MKFCAPTKNDLTSNPLRVLVWDSKHSPQLNPAHIALCDFVILALEDLSRKDSFNALWSIQFTRIVLDEAQLTSPNSTNRFKHLEGLRSSFRWFMSGTLAVSASLEKMLEALCYPLGANAVEWKTAIEEPITEERDIGARQLLVEWMRAEMIRTDKSALRGEPDRQKVRIPKCTHETYFIPLNESQRIEYNTHLYVSAYLSACASRADVCAGGAGLRLHRIFDLLTRIGMERNGFSRRNRFRMNRNPEKNWGVRNLKTFWLIFCKFRRMH